MNDAGGEVGATCWRLLGALAFVITVLTGAIVKLAGLLWGERGQRMQDHKDAQAQMDVVRTSTVRRKEESP